jgi:hypothetical protein
MLSWSKSGTCTADPPVKFLSSNVSSGAPKRSVQLNLMDCEDLFGTQLLVIILLFMNVIIGHSFFINDAATLTLPFHVVVLSL